MDGGGSVAVGGGGSVAVDGGGSVAVGGGGFVAVGKGTVNVGRGIVGNGPDVLVGLGVFVGFCVGVGPGVDVLGGLGVLLGCGMSVLVGWEMSVLLGPRVFVGGFSVLPGRGSDVEARSCLWQSGSALSIKRSPSSSLALKQYSLPPVSGINVTGGTSQRMIESKRIIASELCMVSTYKPTSPVA